MLARDYTVKAVQNPRTLKWRLQVNSGNGKIVAFGKEEYTRKGSAERAAETFAAAGFAFEKLPRENAR